MFSVVRSLIPGDVPSAMELVTAANWNQTTEDWCRIMQLPTAACRCIEDAGKVIATATLLPYGVHLAWIGMVLTRPEYRRQGLARRLMEDVIAIAEHRGIHTLKLDATDEGRPLYESLGFVVEKTVERWGRDYEESNTRNRHPATQGHSDSPQLSDELFSLDIEAFGVKRKGLLQALSHSGKAHTTAGGYVLSRPGRTAQYLGPCVAGSESEAQRLIGAHLEGEQNSNWYWDLLPSNSAAIRCARNFGFSHRRTLWRMRRGEIIENNDAMVYAIAGFDLG